MNFVGMYTEHWLIIMTEEKTYRELLQDFMGVDNEDFHCRDPMEFMIIDHKFAVESEFGKAGRETSQCFVFSLSECTPTMKPQTNVYFDGDFYTLFFPVEEVMTGYHIADMYFHKDENTEELKQLLCQRVFHLNNEEDCKLLFETLTLYDELSDNVYKANNK